MKSTNRSNALLVELLIVVMFFMLSAAVLLQVFATARNQSRRAELMNQALNDAQNIADELYTAPDTGKKLTEMGFEQENDSWRLSNEVYSILVTGGENEGAEGEILRFQIQAVVDDEPILNLPVARYQEVRQ